MAQALPVQPPPAADAAPRLRTTSLQSIARRIVIDRWELWLILALTAFAGFIRFWRLPVLPYGFHGDEANVTLDAQRIIRDHWIGPWSDLSLGYPIAVNYYMAPFTKVLGTSVFSSRLPIAILGTISAPLAYMVIRNVAGWRAGITGALLFTVSLWGLHLSRMAIPVTGWPAAELGALLCIQYGTKTRRWWWFLGAGLLVGVALWIYNSTFIFAFAVGVYLAGWFTVEATRHRDRALVRDLMLLGIFGMSALFAGKPIFDYMRSPQSHYSTRFDQVYIFADDKHDQCVVVPPEKRDQKCRFAVAESFSEKATVVRKNLQQFYTRLVVTGAPDTIDGLGARPPLGKITAYLAIVGAVVAIFRYRTRESVIIGFITVPLLGLATALTLDGQYRRALGMLPFIAMFAGIALGTLWEWAERQQWWLFAPAIVLVFASVGYAANSSLHFYFGDFQEDSNTRFVYSPEVRAAWEYLEAQGHPYVYYWNQRGSLNYETRLVLAPDIAGGEDRSIQFTTEDKTQPVRYDLKPSDRIVQPLKQEPDGAVFLFLGNYLNDIDKVMAKYPGGQLTEKYNDHWKVYDFRAYYLPADLYQKYLRDEGVKLPPVQPQR
jgi:4-amino-4-deoxy-L-arabinose transferase-like glycosyltransferase